MEDIHELDQLILWYQHFSNAAGEAIGEEAFADMQDFAKDELNVLQDCFQKMGSVSLMHPFTMDPDLPTFQAIAESSLTYFSTRFLVHPSTRKFYTNYSLKAEIF
jgi:hypothetical protein